MQSADTANACPPRHDLDAHMSNTSPAFPSGFFLPLRLFRVVA